MGTKAALQNINFSASLIKNTCIDSVVRMLLLIAYRRKYCKRLNLFFVLLFINSCHFCHSELYLGSHVKDKCFVVSFCLLFYASWLDFSGSSEMSTGHRACSDSEEADETRLCVDITL